MVGALKKCLAMVSYAPTNTRSKANHLPKDPAFSLIESINLSNFVKMAILFVPY